MSTTNSPAFDSNMDPNNVVANSSNEVSPVQSTKKMTKKQEKDLERAAKKKAKEDAAAAKELAKKEKEDAKKAKADEKAAKALAKEQAKKDKEEAKAAKELAKKEKAEAKLNKANAKKSNASSSQDLPQESSQDLPQESSQDLPQESSQDLPQESSQNLSQDLPQESTIYSRTHLTPCTSQDLPQESSPVLALEPPLDSSLNPPLPSKFNKFFEFAYFLIQHFEKSGKFSQQHISSMNDIALIFHDTPSQIKLIQSFLDSQKLLSADLKRLRKSSSSNPSSSLNSDFVAQLVQHALHDHNDLPILTNPFSFQDQHFLIDNDNNLYHSQLHHTLGKWDPHSQQIILY